MTRVPKAPKPLMGLRRSQGTQGLARGRNLARASKRAPQGTAQTNPRHIIFAAAQGIQPLFGA
eukprot:4066411-Pyramimonas_sp.AAC.1